jgi:hypothetical protein
MYSIFVFVKIKSIHYNLIWGMFYVITSTKLLHKILTDRNWSHQSTIGPTYWPTHTNRHPDILDFFIHSTPSNLSFFIFNITDLSSNHSPVKLTIAGGINQVLKWPSLTTGPINWIQYKNYLQISTKLGIPLKTAQELDQATLAFVELIESAEKQACHPKNNNYTTSFTILDKHLLPDHIKALIRQKKKKLAPNGNLQDILTTSELLIT